MNKSTGSVLQGVVVVALASVVIFLLGGMLLMSGHGALETGELSVSYFKRGAAVLLRPQESPWRFYGEVWLRLVLGALLIAASVAAPVRVLLMEPARRAERLRFLSRQPGLKRGPNVSPLVACLVLAAFLAFLVIATQRHG